MIQCICVQTHTDYTQSAMIRILQYKLIYFVIYIFLIYIFILEEEEGVSRGVTTTPRVSLHRISYAIIESQWRRDNLLVAR
jgi:hypothetical protein